MQTPIKILIAIFTICILGCRQNPTELSKNLSGYWEIEKVITRDGDEKTFTISPTVDYFIIEGTTGKHTKVNPQLDGSFKNNGLAETFTLDTSSGELVIRYQNAQNARTEKVKKATNLKLVIVNNEGKEYYYKRFEKFNFE